MVSTKVSSSYIERNERKAGFRFGVLSAWSPGVLLMFSHWHSIDYRLVSIMRSGMMIDCS